MCVVKYKENNMENILMDQVKVPGANTRGLLRQVAAVRILNTPALTDRIRTVDPKFNPTGLAVEHTYKLRGAETRTLGELLWSAVRYEANGSEYSICSSKTFQSIRRITLANLRTSGLDAPKLLEFGITGKHLGFFADGGGIDPRKWDYTPELLMVNDTTQTMLAMAGIAEHGILRSTDVSVEEVLQGRLGYVGNSDKVLLSDYRNAFKINYAVSWLTGKPLEIIAATDDSWIMSVVANSFGNAFIEGGKTVYVPAIFCRADHEPYVIELGDEAGFSGRVSYGDRIDPAQPKHAAVILSKRL